MRSIWMIVACMRLPAAVLACHLIASRILGLYSVIPNLDVPFHFVGGLSIGYTTMLVLSFLEREGRIAPVEWPVRVALSITTTATAAVLWEIVEFATDWALGTNAQVSLANTMQDQFVGLLGGTLAGIVILLRRGRDA